MSLLMRSVIASGVRSRISIPSFFAFSWTSGLGTTDRWACGGDGNPVPSRDFEVFDTWTVETARRDVEQLEIRADVLAVLFAGGHGCCTLSEKSRLGALLCLDSSSFLIGYRFPMPRAKEPRGAWPLHCERHFKPIKASGLVGAAR
jgi:hypothetical protein